MKGPYDGVLVDANDLGQINDGRHSLPGSNLTFGDRTPNFRSYLFVKRNSDTALDVDKIHCTSYGSTMSVRVSTTDALVEGATHAPTENQELEQLIREARRRQRRRWSAFAGAFIAAAVILAAGLEVSHSQPKRTVPATQVAHFINSLKSANGARFVATYRLNDYLFLGSGTIVIAQIPSPPGTRTQTNVDGYSGTGRYAYLLRGLTGRIIQWIKIGTNVGACANALSSGNYETGTWGKLRCSRPSPYIPSNAFAEEDVGFVPTYVLQQVTELFAVHSQKRAIVTTRSSRGFGPLRCLTQFSGPTTQTTCIDRAGFIVSLLLQNGARSASRVTLTALNDHPTAGDFKTLRRPTMPLLLPAA